LDRDHEPFNGSHDAAVDSLWGASAGTPLFRLAATD
jgi:hypothetical protein